MGLDPAHESDLQAQIDALVRRVTVNRGDIDALAVRADQAGAAIDDFRGMIAELQDQGVLSREHAEQMEQALTSSRTIGAAIGILMASRNVCQDEAFAILRKASQDSNRKLREVAGDVLASRSAAYLDGGGS